MSQKNVEIVRHFVDLYNRRDFDGLLGVTDPDIEIGSHFVSMESLLRGHEGLRAYFEALDDAYEHFQLVPTDFVDAGAAVVMVGHADWRGKGSGARGETAVFPVFWLRANRIFRTETFMAEGEAFEAVGLDD